MSIDALRKTAVAVLIWIVCFKLTASEVYRMVWPPERRIAAIRAGRYAIDAPNPLPPVAWIIMFTIPTVVVGILVFIYRNRTAR